MCEIQMKTLYSKPTVILTHGRFRATASRRIGNAGKTGFPSTGSLSPTTGSFVGGIWHSLVGCADWSFYNRRLPRILVNNSTPRRFKLDELQLGFRLLVFGPLIGVVDSRFV